MSASFEPLGSSGRAPTDSPFRSSGRVLTDSPFGSSEQVLSDSPLTTFVPVAPLTPSGPELAARAPYAQSEQQHSCEEAIVLAESRHALPRGLLTAIAITESSMQPNALRVSGQAIYPKTKAEALRLAANARSRSETVMAGCMQVNLEVHDPAGELWALDPLIAADWAADYLLSLHDRLGSWASAISAYGGAKTSTAYLYRVVQNLQFAEQQAAGNTRLASYQAPIGIVHADCWLVEGDVPDWLMPAGSGRNPMDCAGASSTADAPVPNWRHLKSRSASLRVIGYIREVPHAAAPPARPAPELDPKARGTGPTARHCATLPSHSPAAAAVAAGATGLRCQPVAYLTSSPASSPATKPWPAASRDLPSLPARQAPAQGTPAGRRTRNLRDWKFWRKMRRHARCAHVPILTETQ